MADGTPQSLPDPRASECVAAVLTPPGRGAIAVLVVQGEQALEIVSRHFARCSGQPLADCAKDQILYGRWTIARETNTEGSSPDVEPEGEDLVVVRRGPQLLEVHCHGGSAAVTRVLDSLVAAGCEPVSAESWLARTQRDPLVTAARLLIGRAITRRTAAILLDQVHGALSRAVRQVLAVLAQGDDAQATLQLENLLQWAPLGAHLIEPWRVTLVGPTNVGKSSLINALLGYQRALVSHQAGTTRDVLTALTACDGWPVELSDTAGMRPGVGTLERAGIGALERAGIKRALLQADQADLRLAVSDLSQSWSDSDLAWYERLPRPVLLVHNKSDRALSGADSQRPPGLVTSARQARGIAELAAGIAASLVPRQPPPGAAVPFLASHIRALQAARDALHRGQVAEARNQLTDLLTPAVH